MTNTLTGTYDLDATHSTVGFTVRHAMVTKVRGNFNDFQATLTVNQENPAESKVEATAETASVDTRNADRDAHVRNEDFFDTDNYPQMTFVSTAFDVDASGNGTVTGDLTIKGTTKSVTLDVETFGTEVDPYGNTRVGFEARTTINRKDFGIDFEAPLNSGGALVGEKIAIDIDGSGIKRA